MRVLVACEFSGIVRDAFIAAGHDAVSCDLLPSERPGPHFRENVLDVLWQYREPFFAPWDLMIAHPPCTFLANSGVRWLYGGKGTTPEAGSDHPALAVRPPRDEGDRAVAAQRTATRADRHRRRADAAGPLRLTRSGSLEEALPNADRHRRGDGRPVGIAAGGGRGVKRSAHSNPLCPQDEAHGELLSWPTSIAAFYCPHVSHVGGHFYRTDLSHSSPAPSREQDRPTRRSLAGTPSIPASGRLPEPLG